MSVKAFIGNLMGGSITSSDESKICEVLKLFNYPIPDSFSIGTQELRIGTEHPTHYFITSSALEMSVHLGSQNILIPEFKNGELVYMVIIMAKNRISKQSQIPNMQSINMQNMRVALIQ